MGVGAIFGGLAQGWKTGSDLETQDQQRKLAINADTRAQQAAEIAQQQEVRSAETHKVEMDAHQRKLQDDEEMRVAMENAKGDMAIASSGMVQDKDENGMIKMDDNGQPIMRRASPSEFYDARRKVNMSMFDVLKRTHPEQLASLGKVADELDKEGVGKAFQLAIAGDIKGANELFKSTGVMQHQLAGIRIDEDPKTKEKSLIGYGVDPDGKPFEQNLNEIAAAYDAKDFIKATKTGTEKLVTGLNIDKVNSEIGENKGKEKLSNSQANYYDGARTTLTNAQAVKADKTANGKADDFVKDSWFKTTDLTGQTQTDSVGHSQALKLVDMAIKHGIDGTAASNAYMTAYNAAKQKFANDPAGFANALKEIEAGIVKDLNGVAPQAAPATPAAVKPAQPKATPAPERKTAVQPPKEQPKPAASAPLTQSQKNDRERSVAVKREENDKRRERERQERIAEEKRQEAVSKDARKKKIEQRNKEAQAFNQSMR